MGHRSDVDVIPLDLLMEHVRHRTSPNLERYNYLTMQLNVIMAQCMFILAIATDLQIKRKKEFLKTKQT